VKLINIRLTNYRKYVEAEADLPDGLTGILGANGAGKSSLLEAVGWVLYGPDATRTGKDDIRRQDAPSDSVCRVELTFAIDNTEYTVVREMRGKNLTTDASIIAGGEVLVRGAQPVLDQVMKIIGLDREAFFVSFFARQKELNALSDYRPADRKSLIIKMLGIDDVDRAVDLVKTERREADATANGLKLKLPDGNILQADLVEAKKILRDAEGGLQQIQSRIAKSDARLTSAKQTFDAEEHKRADNEETQRKRELAVQNAAHFRSLADAKEKELAELTDLKSRRDALAPAIRFAAKAEQVLAQKTVEQTAKHVADLEVSMQKTADALSAAAKAIAAGNATRSELQRAVDRLEKQEADLESLGPTGVCPTCLRPLAGDMVCIKEHFRVDIDDLKKQIRQIDLKVSEQTASERKLTEEMNRHNTQRDSLRSAATHAQDIEHRVDRLIKSLPESESKEDRDLFTREVAIEEKLAYLAQRRDEIMRDDASLKRLPETEQAAKDLDEKAAGAEADIKAIDQAGDGGFDPESYARARKEFEAAQEEKHALALGAKDMEKEKLLAEQQVRGFEQNIAAHDEVAGEIKTLEARLGHLKALEKLLASFRKYLIGRIRPTLAEKASELLYDLTDGKYSKIELNDDYEIFIYDEGGKFSIERFSGGEKDLANLCLRLAISLTLSDRAGSDYGFIVLDEIFGSQDTVRKMNIMRALATLNKRFRQIFLITHVEDIKDEVENVINVTETEEGLSALSLS
jgi:exonuclease SbcC